MSAVALLLLASGSTQAEAASGIAFVKQGEQSFAKGSVSLKVHNPGDAQAVTFRLVMAGLESADHKPVRTEDAFTVTPAAATIPAAGQVEVTAARIAAVKLADKVYKGTLAVFVGGEVADARPLSLTLPDAAVAATPAVETWTVTGHRLSRWNDYRDEGLAIPLEKSAPKGDAARLATLQNGAGRTIIVKGAVMGDHLQLELVERAKTPGKYEGSFDLLPDDDKGKVALTVVQHDDAALPVAVLILSLLAALVLQRWVTAWGPLMRQDERARSARDGLNSAQPPLSVSGASAWYEESGTQRHSLVWRWELVDAKSDEMKAAEKEVAALESAKAAWIAIPGAITAMDGALDAVVASQPPRPPGASDAQLPVFLTKARALKSGAVPAKKVETQLAVINSAAELAPHWTTLHQRVTAFAARLAQLDAFTGSMSEGERALLARAHLMHGAIAWQLWYAEDAADLLRRMTEAELTEADSAVGALSRHLSPPPPQPIGPAGVAVVTPTFAPLGGVLGDIAGAVPASAEAPVLGEIVDVTLSGLSVAIAVATSVWLGLVAAYFDKNFGSLRDYATLVVWGGATAASLDLINGALGKFAPPAPPAEATAAAT